MGALSGLDSRHRLAYPGTPPELVSPSSSSYSSRPSEGAPVSPPMSNYDPSTTVDVLPGKPSDESLNMRRAHSSQSSTRHNEDYREPQQRQQHLPKLPPLSSILTMAHDSMLTHSPYEERRAFSTGTSPLDRPQTSSSLPVPNRPYSPSYFPPTGACSSSSASHPKSSYPPRLEERNPFHSVPRGPFPGPLSPPHRESDHRRADRTPEEYVTRASGEYSPNSRYSYNRSQSDRYPVSIPVVGNHGIKREYDHPSGPAPYRDAHHQRPTTHSHAAPSPPTATSSIVSPEGIPSKDGLGPKIWTGTHFLPRFVRAAEVPGEGMCYFYDDGSHCKTVIDGEVVNAHWGVTKAGKPRKRLAIACVTCREKKIKCDPDYPRCVQCEKFGRVCKFKNAPRGGNNTSPSTPPAELADDVRPRSKNSSASVSPRTIPAAEMRERDGKRPRYAYEVDYSQQRQHSPRQQHRAFTHPQSQSHYSHTPPPPPPPQPQQQHPHQRSYPPPQFSYQHQPPHHQHPHPHGNYHSQPSSAVGAPGERPSPISLPLPLPPLPREGSRTSSSWNPPELPRIR
ncbi:uncharacterized protein PgNI_03375 [Pyricularia grisea]|uniref:Zn(2)-C6 fungal-type domain-containing protein n=1 Tax=Pyricularia grisea TaxID=148305 RepID=A0A6P8B9D0_PYRGI|nr:uncharacterized protein PgNI_03375 [Pyricularia grisea]TLD12434.1 hypothetical protein PgNI_03375 [Pyricularia grisea]